MAQTIKESNESTSPIRAALQAGLVTGVAGFVVGGTIGIARSKVPLGLWTIASSLQWAALGGTYWGLRTSLVQQIPTDERSPSSMLAASAISGGASFAIIGAAVRGRHSILPGGISGTFYGFAGQGLYNILDRRHTEAVSRPVRRKSIWERITTSEWSPITKISDDEYLKMLGEKRLHVDAQIALLDEEIKELEAQQVLRKEIRELRQER